MFSHSGAKWGLPRSPFCTCPADAGSCGRAFSPAVATDRPAVCSGRSTCVVRLQSRGAPVARREGRGGVRCPLAVLSVCVCDRCSRPRRRDCRLPTTPVAVAFCSPHHEVTCPTSPALACFLPPCMQRGVLLVVDWLFFRSAVFSALLLAASCALRVVVRAGSPAACFHARAVLLRQEHGSFCGLVLSVCVFSVCRDSSLIHCSGG